MPKMGLDEGRRSAEKSSPKEKERKAGCLFINLYFILFIVIPEPYW